jgi:uncharacterized protein (DUF2062 family)
MFRRRKPLSVLKQLRAVIWPERGFRRLFSYLFQRIIRLPGTPASIASGFASGVAASFTPFLGLHFHSCWRACNVVSRAMFWPRRLVLFLAIHGPLF